MVEKICQVVLERLLQIIMNDKTCKKCGHLCHCVEADHDGCKCDNCDCNGEQAEQATYEHNTVKTGELVIDDTNDCEWCQ